MALSVNASAVVHVFTYVSSARACWDFLKSGNNFSRTPNLRLSIMASSSSVISKINYTHTRLQCKKLSSITAVNYKTIYVEIPTNQTCNWREPMPLQEISIFTRYPIAELDIVNVLITFSIYLSDLCSAFPQICIISKALYKHSLKQKIYRQVYYLTVITLFE